MNHAGAAYSGEFWVGLGWVWVFVRKQFEVLKLKLEKEWRTT